MRSSYDKRLTFMYKCKNTILAPSPVLFHGNLDIYIFMLEVAYFGSTSRRTC